jgi:hypothetical protein
MSSSNKLTWLTIGSSVSLSLISSPASAESAGLAIDLLPLNPQGVSVQAAPRQVKLSNKVSVTIRPETHYRPDFLESVASNINHEATEDEGKTELSDISDVVDLSFLESFIDDDGDIQLPLGIRVYDAMGMTSIGFGGEF